MDLQTYFKTTGSRKLLAQRVGVSPNYMWQLSVGNAGRKPSPALARRIHEETLGAVDLASLRPDIWGTTTKQLDKG